jgi:hypothetical protein
MVDYASYLFLLCSSPAERDDWFNDYVKAAEKLQANAAVAVAPIWRPDETSGLCSKCNAAFTLLFRKHHCRKCGLIVCANCSKDRVVIANLDSGRPVRVCVTCSARIASGESAPTVSISSPPKPSATIDVTSSPNSIRKSTAPAPPPVPPPNRKPPTPQSIQARPALSQSDLSRAPEVCVQSASPVSRSGGETDGVVALVSSVSLSKPDASPAVEAASLSQTNAVGSPNSEQLGRPVAAPVPPSSSVASTVVSTKVGKLKWPPQRKAADSDDEVDASAPFAAPTSSKAPEVFPQRSIKDRWPPK